MSKKPDGKPYRKSWSYTDHDVTDHYKYPEGTEKGKRYDQVL